MDINNYDLLEMILEILNSRRNNSYTVRLFSYKGSNALVFMKKNNGVVDKNNLFNTNKEFMNNEGIILFDIFKEKLCYYLEKEIDNNKINNLLSNNELDDTEKKQIKGLLIDKYGEEKNRYERVKRF